jgi:glycosyltransferase involved in cell wall biosynthesis
LQRSATISVVIPAYNAGHFIEEAVSSVLAQEMPADEIIVVNDGSTDRDYSGLEQLHHSIRVVQQANRGVSAARNLGCRVATGAYVAILDADDVWLKGKLRAQMRHLAKKPTIDAVFCRGVIWMPDSDGLTWSRPAAQHQADSSIPKAIPLLYSDFLCSIPVAPSTMVIKRSVWQELGGFDENMRYGEDHDFYLRLSHARHVELLDIDGMLYRRHPRSATATAQEENHWANAIIAAVETLGTTDKFGNHADPDKVAGYLSRIHFQHGYEHFRAGGFRIAAREFGLAVRRVRTNHRAQAYLLLSRVPVLRECVRWLLGLR